MQILECCGQVFFSSQSRTSGVLSLWAQIIGYGQRDVGLCGMTRAWMFSWVVPGQAFGR